MTLPSQKYLDVTSTRPINWTTWSSGSTVYESPLLQLKLLISLLDETLKAEVMCHAALHLACKITSRFFWNGVIFVSCIIFQKMKSLTYFWRSDRVGPGPSFHDFWSRNKAPFPSQKGMYFSPIFKKNPPIVFES